MERDRIVIRSLDENESMMWDNLQIYLNINIVEAVDIRTVSFKTEGFRGELDLRIVANNEINSGLQEIVSLKLIDVDRRKAV